MQPINVSETRTQPPVCQEPSPNLFVCDSCAKTFSRKDNLKKHMKIAHNIVAIKNVNAVQKSFTCDSCPKSFTRKYDVFRHITTTHLGIERKALEKQFMCEKCAKSFSRKFDLFRHITTTNHDNIDKIAMEKRFMCESCAKSFTQKIYLLKHMRIVHQIMKNNTSTKSFLCESCAKLFSTKRNLERHEKNIHGIDFACRASEKSFFCDLCFASFSRKFCLRRHMKDRHKISDASKPQESIIIRLTFHDKTEFDNWKETTEERSRSSFRISTSHNLKSTNGKTIVFVCNRSGYYRPRPPLDRKRKPPAYGSRKINAFCPAKIKAKFTDSGIFVEYSPQHVGHEETNELCYMNIPNSNREAIASQLIEGISCGTVLKNIKDSLSTEECGQKKQQMITKHDLRNIRNSYRNGVKKRELIKIQGSIENEFLAINNHNSIVDKMSEHVHLMFGLSSSQFPESESFRIQDSAYTSETCSTVVEKPVKVVKNVNTVENEIIVDGLETRRYSLVKDFLNMVKSAKTEKELDTIEEQYRVLNAVCGISSEY